ncbi:MAG: hypothetical protein K2M12_03955 [Muribaculaceae bacterium]|nr:hypothetical protein [Muribaculaceae bacterium]
MTKELSAKDIKKLSAEQLYAPAAEESLLLVACRRADYSASRMAHAAEDVDAHVLNLNVTTLGADDGSRSESVVVALRVARRDATAVVRSLERYGYDVLDFCSNDPTADADLDSARENAAALLRLLEI